MNQAMIDNMTADEVARYAPRNQWIDRLTTLIEDNELSADGAIAELETERDRLVEFERDKAGDLMRQLIEEHTETKLSLGSELEQLQELDTDLWNLANAMDPESGEYRTLSTLLGELQCSRNGVYALVTAKDSWVVKTVEENY